MTCREIAEFLMDYLNQDLPAETRAVFEKHLDGCKCCIAYLNTYRETVALGHAALCDDPDAPEIPEELVKAILATRAAQR